MKTLEEILKQPGLQVYQKGPDGGSGTLAQLNTSGKRNKRCVVVWSNGGGWDHVSISFADRCPTWEEMCVVKKIFFNPEETVIEYHPAESQYVNTFPYCLHLWRPQQAEIPTPPIIYV